MWPNFPCGRITHMGAVGFAGHSPFCSTILARRAISSKGRLVDDFEVSRDVHPARFDSKLLYSADLSVFFFARMGKLTVLVNNEE